MPSAGGGSVALPRRLAGNRCSSRRILLPFRYLGVASSQRLASALTFHILGLPASIRRGPLRSQTDPKCHARRTPAKLLARRCDWHQPRPRSCPSCSWRVLCDTITRALGAVDRVRRHLEPQGGPVRRLERFSRQVLRCAVSRLSLPVGLREKGWPQYGAGQKGYRPALAWSALKRMALRFERSGDEFRPRVPGTHSLLLSSKHTAREYLSLSVSAQTTSLPCPIRVLTNTGKSTAGDTDDHRAFVKRTSKIFASSVYVGSLNAGRKVPGLQKSKDPKKLPQLRIFKPVNGLPVDCAQQALGLSHEGKSHTLCCLQAATALRSRFRNSE